MKKLALFLALTCITLEACSLKLKLGVINNVGAPVSVLVGNEKIFLKNGGVLYVNYPTVAQGRVLGISFANCEYQYVFPKVLQDYFELDAFNGTVVSQIEGDRSVHLISPLSTVPVDVQERAELQEFEFPLESTGKTCD